jgi:hypothetical protein
MSVPHDCPLEKTKPRGCGVEGKYSSLWLCCRRGGCRGSRVLWCRIYVRPRGCWTPRCGSGLSRARARRPCAVACKQHPAADGDKGRDDQQRKHVPTAFFRPGRAIPGCPAAGRTEIIGQGVVPGRGEVVSGSLFHLNSSRLQSERRLWPGVPRQNTPRSTAGRYLSKRFSRFV